jgi:hypothetical protein
MVGKAKMGEGLLTVVKSVVSIIFHTIKRKMLQLGK